MRTHRIGVLLLLAWSLSLLACGKRESGALPPIAFKVVFEKHSIPKEMQAGERVTTEVQFKNASSLTWPSKPNSKKKHEVNLSYHWLDNKGEMVVFEGLRTGMPNDLKAGESVALKPEILAPDKPGSYVLEVTLVQEGNAWFPERDGEKITVPVNVVDAIGSNKRDAEKKVSGPAAENEQEKKSRREKRRSAREKAKAEF